MPTGSSGHIARYVVQLHDGTSHLSRGSKLITIMYRIITVKKLYKLRPDPNSYTQQ